MKTWTDKTKYRAIVYLTQPFDTGNIKGTPVFYTRSNEDKDCVVDFVKALHAQNIIQAYRVCYSLNGDENEWYMSEDVVYLDFNGPIIGEIWK